MKFFSDFIKITFTVFTFSKFTYSFPKFLKIFNPPPFETVPFCKIPLYQKFQPFAVLVKENTGASRGWKSTHNFSNPIGSEVFWLHARNPEYRAQ